MVALAIVSLDKCKNDITRMHEQVKRRRLHACMHEDQNWYSNLELIYCLVVKLWQKNVGDCKWVNALGEYYASVFSARMDFTP